MSVEKCIKTYLDTFNSLSRKTDKGEDHFTIQFNELRKRGNILKTKNEFKALEGAKQENKAKNRYKDILPYDKTRVKLSEIEGVAGSDYINANVIKGVTGHEGYIATQGPQPHTVDDFWRLLWEYKIQVVVMACNEYEGPKHKCQKYWCEENEELTFGDITVSVTEKVTSEHYVERCLEARKGNETRNIFQFHYTTWPDHFAPEDIDPILDLITSMRTKQNFRNKKPIVVHCSAGCGRTGTIIAIDFVWNMLKYGKLSEEFDLFKIIEAFREQRPSLVQSAVQYKFVYDAVKEIFERHLATMDENIYENTQLLAEERSDANGNAIYGNVTVDDDSPENPSRPNHSKPTPNVPPAKPSIQGKPKVPFNRSPSNENNGNGNTGKSPKMPEPPPKKDKPDIDSLKAASRNSNDQVSQTPKGKPPVVPNYKNVPQQKSPNKFKPESVSGGMTKVLPAVLPPDKSYLENKKEDMAKQLNNYVSETDKGDDNVSVYDVERKVNDNKNKLSSLGKKSGSNVKNVIDSSRSTHFPNVADLDTAPTAVYKLENTVNKPPAKSEQKGKSRHDYELVEIDETPKPPNVNVTPFMDPNYEVVSFDKPAPNRIKLSTDATKKQILNTKTSSESEYAEPYSDQRTEETVTANSRHKQSLGSSNSNDYAEPYTTERYPHQHLALQGKPMQQPAKPARPFSKPTKSSSSEPTESTPSSAFSGQDSVFTYDDDEEHAPVIPPKNFDVVAVTTPGRPFEDPTYHAAPSSESTDGPTYQGGSGPFSTMSLPRGGLLKPFNFMKKSKSSVTEVEYASGVKVVTFKTKNIGYPNRVGKPRPSRGAPVKKSDSIHVRMGEHVTKIRI